MLDYRHLSRSTLICLPSTSYSFISSKYVFSSIYPRSLAKSNSILTSSHDANAMVRNLLKSFADIFLPYPSPILIGIDIDALRS